MHSAKLVLAAGLVGAIAVGSVAPLKAQYYYPPPGYAYPPPGYGYRSYPGADPNGCPPGYSLQGGNCAPYRGPRGGGYYPGADPNGCPPGYSLQGGNCAPYRGPRGQGYYPGADPNGCPPGYSLQGGNCAPYRGPYGPGAGYYYR
jgi:hypothetical protein